MSIVFLILKIIGVIILIPLIILALLLVCPISYRMEAGYDKKPYGKARIRWAFPLFGVKAVYEDSFDVTVRILGIPVFRTDEEKWSLLGGFAEEKTAVEEIPEKEIQKDSDVKENRERHFIKEVPEDEKEEGSVTDILDLSWEEEEEEKVSLPKKRRKEKKQKFFLKRIVEFFRKCYNKGKNILQKIKQLVSKGASILDLLEDEELRSAAGRIKEYLLRGGGYLMPQKLEGRILFGLDDPAVTGRVLGWIAAAMPFYGDRLEVTPDFTRQVIEGDILISGRIRRYKLLKLAWDVYRDKDLLRQKDRAAKIIGG